MGENYLATSITLTITTSHVILNKFLNLKLLFWNIQFRMAGIVAFRILIPCSLVGGYRRLEGDFASIYRVEVIKVRKRFECLGRLAADRSQSKHSSDFVFSSVCISSTQIYFDII